MSNDSSLKKDFAELEKLTEEFEAGDIDLEQGIPKFKRGLELARKLKKRLGEIENEIKEIKDEFKDIEILLDIDIAGKQKNLPELVDKVSEIFKMAFTNPANFQAVMKMPGMAQVFNDVLQYSGISEVNFASMPELPQPMQPPQLPPAIPASLPAQPVAA